MMNRAGYLTIYKEEGKVYFMDEFGNVSRKWGPRMKHKGTNIYELSIKLLNGENQLKIESGNLHYDLLQPDLLLLSLIHKNG